jgi:NTP pyrophosphatase (non-canonical NTP hydrolase)
MPDTQQFSDAHTTVGQLKRLVEEFVDERDWGKYHNAKDVAIAINVEAGELLELFEWVREKDTPFVLQEPAKRQHLGEELADIIMLCLNLASVSDFDVSSLVEQKMQKNREKYPVEQVKGNYRKYTELRERHRQ